MAFTSLTESDLEAGKPLKTEILQTIRTNLDDLDNRVGAAINDKVIVFNEMLNKDEHPNGTLMWSFYDEASFRSVYGDGWTLVDNAAQTCVLEDDGDTFNIPVGSRRFLYNRGGLSTDFEGDTVDLGDLLVDKTAAPAGWTTTGSDGGDHTHNISTNNGAATGTQDQVKSSSSSGVSESASNKADTNGAHTHGATWATATRPDAIVANLFVKKQPNTYTKKLIYKVTNNIRLNAAVITSMIAGNSGTLEVDVRYGSSLSDDDLATVFSTKPSVVYTAGNYSSSTNAVFSTTDISTGEWLVLDITSVMDRDPECHILLEATLDT